MYEWIEVCDTLDKEKVAKLDYYVKRNTDFDMVKLFHDVELHLPDGRVKQVTVFMGMYFGGN